jgi:hypothetical protein
MDKYKIRVPSGAPVYPTTDENWFQFPYVMLSIAKKNSGKTCSLSQFLHIQHKMDRLDRLILISPTAHTNAHYFVGLPLAEEDIIEPSIHSAKQLMDIVENEAYLFDKYHDDMVEWRRLQKEIKSHKDIHDIDEDLLLYFDRMERPKYKYMRWKTLQANYFGILRRLPRNDVLLAKCSKQTTQARHSPSTPRGDCSWR